MPLMTKTQTIAALAERSGLQKAEANKLLEELANLAYQEAKDGFTIPGIGKLVLVDRAARMGRNPATGETISIPAKKVVKFRVAKVCKDTILG
ncbi:MAG: HU family DNA-binding protein [Kiritimatiellae bacterium]|nr:HU family DNA-binding protein [Kiritimatiellia bacterium]